MRHIKDYKQIILESLSQENLDYSLNYEARSGSHDAIRELLDKGANPNSTAVIKHNNLTYTPLHWLADRNMVPTIMLILDKGAHINALDSNGETPLHWAVQRGQEKAISTLLNKGANPNIANNKGETPLHLVALYGGYGGTLHLYKDIAKLLISKGADPFDIFKDPLEIINFFDGDIDWMPEGPLKTKLMRMKRGRRAFGM